MKQYSSSDELIKQLIKGDDVSFENFCGASLGKYGDYKDFIQRLLTYLSNECYKLGHDAVRESDLPTLINGVAEFINNHADLVDEYLENYLEDSSPDKSHWNESLGRLLEIFKTSINSATAKEAPEVIVDGKVTDSNGVIPAGQGLIAFRLDGLIFSDAGNYFGDEENNYSYNEICKNECVWDECVVDDITSKKYILKVANKEIFLEEDEGAAPPLSKYIVRDEKTLKYYYLTIRNEDILFTEISPTPVEKDNYEKAFHQFIIDDLTQVPYRIKLSDGEIFLSEEGNETEKWVRPWFNVDGDSYKAVRSSDKIFRILNSKKDLQFTRFKENENDYLFNSNKAAEEIIQKYLRLIMPKYSRTVEIEDLDRNFWVIGQTIGTISAYLFGDDSPLISFLKGLIDEIAQLWENVFYLWAAVNESSKKDRTGIKVIIFPINNSELFTGESYYDEVRFDNYCRLNGLGADNILNKISYLSRLYNKNNLVVIPEIRQGNYYRGYYSKVSYPFVYTYSRTSNYAHEWKKFQIGDSAWSTIDMTSPRDVIAARTSSFCIEDDSFYYIKNCSENSVHSGYYYRAISTAPQVDLEKIEIDDSGNLNLSDDDAIMLTFSDVAEQIMKDTISKQNNQEKARTTPLYKWRLKQYKNNNTFTWIREGIDPIRFEDNTYESHDYDFYVDCDLNEVVSCCYNNTKIT